MVQKIGLVYIKGSVQRFLIKIDDYYRGKVKLIFNIDN